MIEPTVGREGWYQPHRAPFGAVLGDQPFKASVCFVHSDRLVNLLVVDHVGHTYAQPNVILVQDGDVKPTEAPYAEWMPYQKGQAAKAEALQAQAAPPAPQTPTPQPNPAPAPQEAAPAPQTPAPAPQPPPTAQP